MEWTDWMTDHHNQRRRKRERVAAKIAAYGVYDQKTKSWSGPPRTRCEIRDKNGHRCRHKPHQTGNHSAFGKEWPR
jgi:hypothetical protein